MIALAEGRPAPESCPSVAYTLIAYLADVQLFQVLSHPNIPSSLPLILSPVSSLFVLPPPIPIPTRPFQEPRPTMPAAMRLGAMMPRMASSLGVIESLTSLDFELGRAIHGFAQKSKLQKSVASFFSLLVDEAVWFGLPLLSVALSYAAEVGLFSSFGFSFLPSPPEAAAYRVFFMLLYTEVTLVIAFGAGAKLLSRTPRPTYAKQGTFFITNGDRYSFPSGHSFFAMTVVTALGDLYAVPLVLKVVFVLGVCWSRVAKGKHYPLDTVCGVLLGLFIGNQSLTCSSAVRWSFKIAVAAIELLEIFAGTIWHRFRTPGYVAGVFFLSITFLFLPYGDLPPPPLMLGGDDNGNWRLVAFSKAGAAFMLACPLFASFFAKGGAKSADATGAANKEIVHKESGNGGAVPTGKATRSKKE